MDVYLARQPIFDRNREIFAYELLFRGGMENFFPDIDGDSATSRLLSNTFFNTGLEQITGGKRAFINFTRELIMKRAAMLFPAQLTTVEILENIRPDCEIVDELKELVREGYVLALDDFLYSPELEPFIELADIVKIDFKQSSHQEIMADAAWYLSKDKKLLAEKVETSEEFDLARSLGFTYFQGYFFSKPQLIRKVDIPTLKMNMLNIMAEARKDDFNFGRLESLISRDLGISYKLLRYLNSPYYRRLSEISSIRQAIVMLGEKGINQFLGVIILSELSQDKPDELLKSSVIRARMCENFGTLKGQRDSSELFTLGLFSHIDAILDNTMEHIMTMLPLSESIKKTLLG
ncbi:MAG: HDOD domain-containing protein, partial [Syntrophaceae bacterium]